MSCCGGKHINMIQVNQEDNEVDYILKLNNPENKETVILEHLIGGSVKIYTVKNKKYSAGGKYKLIEVYKEHLEELLEMKKFNRYIFRVVDIQKNDDIEEEIVIERLEENSVVITKDDDLSLVTIETESKEDTQEIDVDIDKLLEDNSITIADTTLEMVDENPQLEEKITPKRKRKSNMSEE